MTVSHETSRSDSGHAAMDFAHGAMAAPAAVLAARVRWLVRVRWYSGALLIGLALLMYWRCASAISAGDWAARESVWNSVSLALLGVLVLGVNVIVVSVLWRYAGLSHDEAARRMVRLTASAIATDMLAWIVAMHLTGGMMNPLAAVLVFMSAVAASLLPLRSAYILVVVAGLLCVTAAVVESGHLLGGVPFLVPSDAGIRGVVSATGPAASGPVIAGVFSGINLVVMVLTVYFTSAILERLRGINHRLLEANRQLSALDLTKSRFLRVSSHQLRGPLAAVHTLISAVESSGPLTDKQRELSGRIQARADEIMSQLDEMMLLSTIKENASETQACENVELGGVLSETITQFEGEARQKGLSISFSGNGTAKVCAWPDAVETVFEHLLSNAVKYTPQGGKVSVTARHDGPRIRVEVADTGIGIPAEQQDRLFHEFFRATNARQLCGGTGLGLSIVKAIVEKLGGQIMVISPKGIGTTVTVSLPLVE